MATARTGRGSAVTATNGYGVFCWGNGGYTGSWSHYSDARMKKDVETLNDGLGRVLALRGVSFTWRRDEFPEQHLNDGPQIGFVAQEVEPVLPEVVTTDPQGFKAVDYSMMTPLLVEAIKQQQAIIERHENGEAELRTALAKLETRGGAPQGRGRRAPRSCEDIRVWPLRAITPQGAAARDPAGGSAGPPGGCKSGVGVYVAAPSGPE